MTKNPHFRNPGRGDRVYAVGNKEQNMEAVGLTQLEAVNLLKKYPQDDLGMHNFIYKYVGGRYKRVTVYRGLVENPGEIEQIAKGFHGRPPSENIEIDEEERYPTDLAVIGCLVELNVTRDNGETCIALRFKTPKTPGYKKGEEVYVAAPSRDYIEFVGGDQKIVNLKAIAKYTDKQYVKLGCVDSIVYLTDKHHLVDSNGKEEEYEHDFGKKKMFGFSKKRSGRPELIYDSLNEQLKLVGGSYSIKDEGIVN